MVHESKENMNRRDFFRNLAFLSFVTFSTKSLYAKGSKKRFEYQDSPKNGKVCKDCMHFEPETNTCKIIEGSINPQGWCNLYRELPQ